MSTQEVFIVTLSKHFGIQKKAFATFAEAWAYAADQLTTASGEVLHTSADECFTAHKSIEPCFTENWTVGQLAGDAQVGPTMIFRVEL